MLTSEGHIVSIPELGPRVVTMLRYWRSERTLWLHDVFGVPQPLSTPQVSVHSNTTAIATTDDPKRGATDPRVLTTLLGRDPFTSAFPRTN